MMDQLSYERIEVLLNDTLEDPEKSFCFIAAGTGTGKTQALMTYCKMHEKAVYLNVPLSVLKSSKSIITSILESLDVLTFESQMHHLFNKLAFVLREKQVSLLVIDNFQEIGNPKLRNDFLEMVSFLSNETHVKFVFAGTQMPQMTQSIERRSKIQNVV